MRKIWIVSSLLTMALGFPTLLHAQADAPPGTDAAAGAATAPSAVTISPFNANSTIDSILDDLQQRGCSSKISPPT